MRNFFVKYEEISDPNYGSYPGSRSVEELINNSVVIIDKPPGPTSHQVVTWVRNILGSKKAGHSGTLDPGVTGVLVVTLGKACKIMPALMGLDKEYIALMELHDDVQEDLLEEVLEKFTGKIKQIPPRKSAVKRKIRVREIYEIKILEREGRRVLMDIKCQKGTYIRKLIHDIGKKLGCGAHMRELRRIKVGPFGEDIAVRLQDLKDAYVMWKENGDTKIKEYLRPVEFGVEHLKKVIVKDSAVNALANGAPLGIGGISRIEEGITPDEMVAIFTEKGELLGLGYASMSTEEAMKKRHGLFAKIDTVMMDKDTYPKMWGQTKKKND
ncbi:MAG: RNA-guided pseudouridylation complex pseudouridine synthase subunit Cbf5 [Candidatus Aenigmarchaeota archaeon]|nr:RNA-guided pseudouridylation complex pseudouridine synthase subunit Cbf5 [Candidatus Aenigmarchaeota archaeon]